MATKTKEPKATGSTRINLDVPNDIYYSVSDKAAQDTREAKEKFGKEAKKKTIHDKMIETLRKGNK